MAAPGQEKVQSYLDAGFSPDEVEAWMQGKSSELQAADFSETEILDYFGMGHDEMPEVRRRMEESYGELQSEEGRTEDVTFLEALDNGFDFSNSGMLLSGEIPKGRPDTGDLSTFDRAVTNAATVFGDLPFIAAGGMAGLGVSTSFGLAAPVVAPAVGAAVAFGVNSLVRQALIDQYERDDGTSVRSFAEDFGRAALSATKGAVTGAAVGAVGGASTLYGVPALAKFGAEVGTLTTVSAGLEARLPEWQEFTDAAILIGGLRVSTKATKATTTKLTELYKKHGVRPRDVLRDAEVEPSIKEDLLSHNIQTPRAYGGDSRPKLPMKLQESITKEALKKPVADSPEARILERVDVGGKTPKVRRTVMETLDEYYTATFDRLHPINRAVIEMEKALKAEGKIGPEGLSSVENAYRGARLQVGVAGKAQHFLDFSPFEFKTLTRVGRPLKSILEPVKDDMQRIRVYMISRRAIEVEAQGKRSGVNLEDARKVVANPKNRDLAPIMTELGTFQQHLLKYLRDSGIVSEKDFKTMSGLSSDYIPFFRVMEGAKRGDGLGTASFSRNPIRRMFGSDARIVDPIESIIKNTYAFITLAERNGVGERYIRLAERAPNGSQYAVKVKTKVKPIKITGDEMKRVLAKLDKDQELSKAEIELLDQNPIFRPAALRPQKNQVALYRNGVREVWEIDPKVFEAFEAMDGFTAGIVTKIMAQPAKLLRAGSVLSPEFMARNINRDQLSAYLFSGAIHPLQTIMNTGKGMFNISKKTDLYQEWLRSGGPQATLLSMDRDYLQGQQRAILGKGGANLFESGRNVLRTPLEYLRATSELLENATRVGEFGRMEAKRAKSGRPKTRSTIEEGGFQSREVTLDFGRMGARIQSMNMITAFFNAALQGEDRLVRAFKDNPAAMTAKVTGSIVVPSMILHLMNRDEPGFEEIPQWQKDLFWMVPVDTKSAASSEIPSALKIRVGEKTWFRLPKPHTVGVVFGTGTERVLDFILEHDPAAFDDFMQTVYRGMTPSVVPTGAIPVIEAYFNHSIFLDRPLIPSNREGALPEYQYTPYTTELTKAIGAAIADIPGMRMSKASSPAIIDNFIRGWTGGLGQHLLTLSDKGLREAGVLPPRNDPFGSLSDIPIIKAFTVRYPTGSAESIQTFYERYQENRVVLDTLSILQREGEFDAYTKLLDDLGTALPIDLSGHVESMSGVSREIRMVWMNPEIPPDEKRQIIDELYLFLIELGKAGNQILDGFEESQQ